MCDGTVSYTQNSNVSPPGNAECLYMKWWSWNGGSCTLYWNWDQILAPARNSPGNLYQRNCPPPETCDDGIQNQDEEGVDCGGVCPACETCTDGVQNQDEEGVDCGGVCPVCAEWKTVDGADIENHTKCVRIAGSTGDVKVSDDGSASLGFNGFPFYILEAGTLRCDISLDFVFTGVEGSFIIDPTDPITSAAQTPKDNYSISYWGSQQSLPSGTDPTQTGWIAMGTPETIVIPGNLDVNADTITTTKTVVIPNTDVQRTNTVRFEVTQPSMSNDLTIKNISLRLRLPEDSEDWTTVAKSELEGASCSRIHGTSATYQISTNNSAE
eukprot:UN30919